MLGTVSSSACALNAPEPQSQRFLALVLDVPQAGPVSCNRLADGPLACVQFQTSGGQEVSSTGGPNPSTKDAKDLAGSVSQVRRHCWDHPVHECIDGARQQAAPGLWQSGLCETLSCRLPCMVSHCSNTPCPLQLGP